MGGTEEDTAEVSLVPAEATTDGSEQQLPSSPALLAAKDDAAADEPLGEEQRTTSEAAGVEACCTADFVPLGGATDTPDTPDTPGSPKLDMSCPDEQPRTESSAEPFDHTTFRKKMIAASLGSVLEWYDFALFGGLASVLGDVFFPGEDDEAKLMMSLAVFGAAFVMRPIGGLAVGYIGDHIGRKPALQLSILLMMIPSFLIGCLPTFAQASYGATAMLCLLRLVQGLAVGGELVSAYVFCIESAPEATKLFWGAVTLDAANLGTLLGTGMSGLLKGTMSDQMLRDWGWRMGFWFGIVAGAAGIMLRRGMGDSHQMESDQGETFGSHAKYTISNHGSDVAVVAGVASIWCTSFYQTFVWMPYLFSDELIDDAISGGAIINTCMFAFTMIIFLPIAWVASKWDNGAVKLIRIGQIGLVTLAIPAYWLISFRSPAAAVFAQLLLGVPVACVGAGLPYFLISAFPPKVRTFAVGIAYNVAQAIFGGVTPVTSSALAQHAHPVLPAVWLMIVSLVSIISLCVYEKRLARCSLDAHVELEDNPGNKPNSVDENSPRNVATQDSPRKQCAIGT